MKLPGRTPILIEFAKSEYDALKKSADERKVSMTIIIRDLLSQYMMHEDLVTSSYVLSKRVLAGETQAVVVHLADDEYSYLNNYSDSNQISMSRVVRNLVRKHIMGVAELKEDED